MPPKLWRYNFVYVSENYEELEGVNGENWEEVPNVNLGESTPVVEQNPVEQIKTTNLGSENSLYYGFHNPEYAEEIE